MIAARRQLPISLSTLVVALPVVTAIWFGFTAGGGETWTHILNNRMIPYTLNTLGVMALSALMMLIIAVPAAWLISVYDFPGRQFFEWALILPLAMPGYVMAYAWADLANVSGPLQASLRDLTGLSARDYWFPDLFTVPGLAFVMAATLYPYVYLTARAAFTTQSASTIEAARSLGAPGFSVFAKVALPAARPAIAAGLALALMETAADYGAADYLGIQTLGVGIIRAWGSFSEPATAARLAVVLIFIAFAFVGFERASRGRAGSQHTGRRWTRVTRKPLTGPAAWIAMAGLALILVLCFVTPLARLIWLAVEHGVQPTRLIGPLVSSLVLGTLGMVATFLIALPIALMATRNRKLGWVSRLAAASGYAAPGAVLGLGGLFLLQSLGLPLSGGFALGVLIWIYVARFSTIGAEPMIAAHARAPKSLGEATQSLGVSGLSRVWRVDVPVLWPGMLAGGLILFVETLKELPATLMLRPFGWDTLAVRAHAYASDERLAAATLPSVLITLAGIIPVILLSRQLTKSGIGNS